jgi:hypothetical protein
MADNERRKPKESTADVQLWPDGWDRFEQAVYAALKTGAKHRGPVRH